MTQQPVGQEARGGRDERRRCDERQRRRGTRGGGATRGDTTTSQIGQREGRNKGAQQEAKARRESEAPADGRRRRDSPVLHLCFNTKREGRVGENADGTEYLCHLEKKSWGGGGVVGCVISKDIILAIRVS